MVLRIAPILVFGFVCSAALADSPLPKAPEGMKATIFAQPPDVSYPTAIAAAPTGELFVAVDTEGSLGKAPGKGKVVRCIDTKGEGRADKFTTFAVMDHPRGLIYDHNTLWVLHPPTLTVYFDDNGDGVSDRSKDLVTNISTKLNEQRGADHTTNGIRMGIDGWIYIAVGDFGMVDATGTDGKKLTLHAGGIVRVRPDGTELELYESGNRNMYDVAIDPYMNCFTRDNTNDGGGWNSRLAHNIQTANYGYPSLFVNFGDEIMPPLADYGGGSGTGSMYLHEPGFPIPYNDALLTCDWGRSIVYHNALKPAGATFIADQKAFLSIASPTDIDVDGQSHLYVSSWHGGGFSWSGPNVGYVVQLTPTDYKPEPFPDLARSGDSQLVGYLASPSAVRRLASQREILRRKPTDQMRQDIERLIADAQAPLYGRVAAIYTYKQLLGEAANPGLVKLYSQKPVREWILRALTDRLTQLNGVPSNLFKLSLSEDNPRVRMAALVGIARLGDTSAASQIVPLTRVEGGRPAVATPLIKPVSETGVIRDHVPVYISANIAGATKLYLVVDDGGDGTGNDHAAWIEPRLISNEKPVALTTLKWKSATCGWGGVHIDKDCQDQPMKVQGKIVKGIGTHARSVIVYDLPKDITRFEAFGTLDDGSKGGSVKFQVFTTEPPDSADTAPTPKWPGIDHVIPHVAVQTLVTIHGGDACLAALSGPNRDGALWALKKMHEPAVVSGLIAKLNDKSADTDLKRGVAAALVRLYNREADYTDGSWWGTRPDTTGPYFKRVTWAESERIGKALKDAAESDRELGLVIQSQIALVHAAIPGIKVADAAKAVDETPKVDLAKVTGAAVGEGTIGKMKYESAVAETLKLTGDPKVGGQLFTSQGCVVCHTTVDGQQPKGPHLANIGSRYKPAELLESILKPSARIAQGFDTVTVKLKDGSAVIGFVVREGAESIEVRDITGKSTEVMTDKIASRTAMPQSIMPEGLAAALTPQQLASLLAYLNSLK